MGDDFVPGQRIGDYEVLGVLGAGGMGKVYKVRNTISDRVEAMKVLLANLTTQKELADRFLREIKLLASLNHPNIAALNTAMTLNNQLIMMMEFVDGTTLATRLQQGPIAPAEAVSYSTQLLSALSYAHKLNVIHRDVKPANMMLTHEGVVKLMDFGIARPNNEQGMTVTGTTLGSLNYMSPEQVRGEAVDARSDLYSMGVSIYEMVTGQLPFRGHSNYSIMSAHLQETPQPPVVLRPDLPKGLSDIILMSMAKDPKDRFQSADAFANALRSVVSGGTISAGAAGAGIVSPVPGTVRVPSSVAVPAPAVVPTVPMAVAAAPAARSSNRGVYMALGGFLVLLLLFAGGFYLPRIIKTHASAGAASQPAGQPASDAPVDISAPPADAVTVTAPAQDATPPAAAPPQEDPNVTRARQEAAQEAAQKAQEKARAEAAEAARKAALLKEVENQDDQLEARSAAIGAGLNNLRRQQQAAGYGLRGDIEQTEQMMQINLSRAQSALHNGNPDQAKEYLDKAEANAMTLERFLGR
jgi:eukaryotic-like serine/threonine-protein kinase